MVYVINDAVCDFVEIQRIIHWSLCGATAAPRVCLR